MGYAKQMMEVAQTWLQFNPDPKNPFLKVPGLDKNRELRDVLTDEKKLRYAVAAAQNPKIAPYVKKLKELDREIVAERGELHRHEDDLEGLISTLRPGQEKYADRDDHLTAGRWCLTWARSGYNLFDLSSDFVAAMLLTDARELDVDLVRLPFPAILIMVPDGFAIGAEGRSYTKIHVTEILGNDLRMLHAGNRVASLLDKLDPDAAHRVLQNLQTTGQIGPSSLLDRTGASLVGPSAQLRTSAQSGALHIYATDGVSVLDTLIDRKDLTWDAFDDLPDSVTDDADKRARQTLRQIVFGMLAYANAIDRAVEPRFPKDRRPPPSSKPHVTQWTVGRTVRINPVLVQMARGGNREAMFRLKHRFIVRGHYRNQAHGPQRTLRTSRWILPHYKGPEDGAMLVHTYKLDDPGDATS
jgi:hypothetical protein